MRSTTIATIATIVSMVSQHGQSALCQQARRNSKSEVSYTATIASAASSYSRLSVVKTIGHCERLRQAAAEASARSVSRELWARTYGAKGDCGNNTTRTLQVTVRVVTQATAWMRSALRDGRAIPYVFRPSSSLTGPAFARLTIMQRYYRHELGDQLAQRWRASPVTP